MSKKMYKKLYKMQWHWVRLYHALRQFLFVHMFFSYFFHFFLLLLFLFMLVCILNRNADDQAQNSTSQQKRESETRCAATNRISFLSVNKNWKKKHDTHKKIGDKQKNKPLRCVLEHFIAIFG